MDPNDPRHGTPAGQPAHRKAGEKPCAACRRASSRARKRNKYLADTGRPPTVPRIGTTRRIRALQAIGWTLPEIASAANLSAHTIHKSLYYGDRATVYRATAEAVSAAYERLSMKLPPQETGQQRRNAGYARTIAQKNGWAPPLAWLDIDDPDEVPAGQHAPRDIRDTTTSRELDPVVVERVLAGDYRYPATVAEKREVVRRWPGAHNELGRLTGWKIERYIDRADGAA